MSTQIIYLDYEKSEALEREIKVFHQEYDSLALSKSDYLSKYPTAESYTREYMSRIEGLEFQRHVEKLNGSCRVLDVGVGRGESSIYLASQGHSVSIVEPSPALCKFVNFVADLYDLHLDIYNCNAESIHKIDKAFDVVIFNSSFHHCDQPLKVLKNCYNSLSEKGRLILVNEPILQFFKTKKWFYDRLRTHPEEMGHYGGNEHIYRYHEYMKMLKLAHFSKIASEPNIYSSSYQQRVKQAVTRTNNGKPFYKPRTLTLKKAYYYGIDSLKSRGFLGKQVLEVLKHMSMLQTTFIASK